MVRRPAGANVKGASGAAPRGRLALRGVAEMSGQADRHRPTNREIGVRLSISPKTVAAHVEHILTKLGAGRRTEIAAWVTIHAAGGGGLG